MNREWSLLNKTMQSQLKKATFDDGVQTLLTLRGALMDEMLGWKKELCREAFNAMPYINADGYHSKSIAYSLWHIFRIEDIVLNTLIRNTDEVFFADGYDKKTLSPIITTGNELVKEQIARFSEKLDIDALYGYISDVKLETDKWLTQMDFSELKHRFSDEDKERIKALGVVSEDENACWLVDYWCGKDVKGLIQMPFSRHWIMHVEAAARIKNGIKSGGNRKNEN